MKVKIKKLNAKAIIPAYAHETDAGLDMVAVTKATDANGNIVYGTGLAIEIPAGFVGLLFPRSSIANKNLMLTNSVGVIDSGYRGEIMAKYKPVSSNGTDDYKVGDRICQLLIMPYPKIEFEEVQDLADSDRGTGGYGSTNREV